MRFIKHIINLNKFKIGIIVILCMAASQLVSCSTVSETFMQSNYEIYEDESIEQEARTVVPLDGGQINIAMPLDPITFNPLKNKNINMINIFSVVFETPLSIDVNGVIRANLIENWSYDETGMIWTFNIRKNIMWHNGLGELTADDLVFTMNLIKQYTAEESVYARYNKRIDNFYAQDKYTFVVETIDPTIRKGDTETVPDPSSYIEYAMVFPVLCKAYYENTDNIATAWPIGTGAYEFTSYKQEEGIRLDVNDDWWKVKPYISSIMAKPLSDADAEIAAYIDQEIDLVGTSDRSASSYTKYGETNVEEYMTQYYDCLVPNLYSRNDADPMFVHDVRARQAIAYALDKSQIISKGLINHAIATDVPIPPDSWLFDTSLTIYEYNQNQAIQIIEELGYTEFDDEGFRARIIEETGELETLVITMIYPKEINDSYKRNIASLIEEQLEDVGMRIDLYEVDADKFQKRIEVANFDLALVTYFIDRNPDVKFMLHSSRSSANYGYYEDEIMDVAIDECGVALTDEDKKTAYSKMQDIFIKQLPHIPLYFKTNSLVYDYSIKGVSDYRSLNIFNNIQNWYVISDVY